MEVHTTIRNLQPTIELLEAQLPQLLSAGRYEHTLRVADLIRTLAVRWGQSLPRARLAALGHDLAREWPTSRLLETAQRHAQPIDSRERRTPLLLHGRAAAVILQENYSVDDPDILQAVGYHTLGHPTLAPLGQLLFCADYLEPERSHISETFRTRAISGNRLAAMVLAIIDYAATLGWPRAPVTEQMYQTLAAQL